MSAYPAFAMGGLCIAGGLAGFARRRSVPSLVAGLSVGAAYLYAADRIRRHEEYGIEGAAGASALLFLASAPRAIRARAPVPAGLAASAALAGVYYARTAIKLRRHDGA